MKTNPEEAAYPIPGIYDPNREMVNPVTAYFNAEGLSKRERFAMAAMQGLLAGDPVPHEFNEAQIARMAVDRADALIAALNKE